MPHCDEAVAISDLLGGGPLHYGCHQEVIRQT